MRNPDSEIWINGRFLTRSVTGVERVAIELLKAFERDHLDHDGLFDIEGVSASIRLVIPTSVRLTHNPFSRIPIISRGRHSGHLWEQLSLPLAASGKVLVNLCNTGPVLKRHNLVFLHDAGVFQVPESYSFAFRSWYRFLMRCFALSGTALMTNSQFSQDKLSEILAIEPKRLPVVTLGHEHIHRTTADDTIFERTAITRNKYVLAVGSANPLKNHAGLVRAIAQLDDEALPCIVVGRFNHKVFNSANDPNNTAEEDKESTVRHIGPVTDEELVALYRQATLLVIPSFYEGFGLPPLEAMASGCPVLLSDRASLPEVGGDAAQFCDPDNPTDIADAITRICADNELRRDMSRRGQERAAHYTWRRGANDIAKLIQKEFMK